MRLALAASLALAAAACARDNPNQIEVHGTLADGTPLDGVYPGSVDFTTSPWRLSCSGSGPETIEGFWLWFDPNVVAGMPYPSNGADPNSGPVHFFVLRPAPDAGAATTASLVDGGQIVFSSVGPDTYSGSLAGLALVRSGQTVVTIDRGSFVAARR